MAEPSDTRVAVYIDFDNIVISRYDQVHGRGQFHKDRARITGAGRSKAADEMANKLEQAQVDVGAVLDFAASFGPIIISRAYADWSTTVNSSYRQQLVGRAVDLTQMFPTTSGLKNGADIRLAVDVIEDLFRIEELTHVVIVAGDSDYIALAQRSKRLGRYVVGIGVAGSYNRALAAACDEFRDYDQLPGVTNVAVTRAAAAASATRAQQTETQTESQPGSESASQAPATRAKENPRRARSPQTRSGQPQADAQPEDKQAEATELLTRALAVAHAKNDAEWLHAAGVKTQMQRMDPSFDEKVLGYRSFSDFIKSREAVAEIDANSPTNARTLRLRQ
jgi:NYN domain/OST-HTH/LOTUS domain